MFVESMAEVTASLGSFERSKAEEELEWEIVIEPAWSATIRIPH
jgi:hypothetical protein